MEATNQEPVPQAVQDIIQATVDRAIATLLESGLLDRSRSKSKGKRGGKGRHSRSRSRSQSKGRKDKGKGKKCSSTSSSSDTEDERRHKGKKGKGKGRRRSYSRSHDRNRRRTRSHSRGRRSRSQSRSKSRHHDRKGGHHRHAEDAMLMPFYHHYFNCPYMWTEGEETGRSGGDYGRKGKKHGHKHWRKFYCQRGIDNEQTENTNGRKETNEAQKDNTDKDSDLSKDFENLDVTDKDKFVEKDN